MLTDFYQITMAYALWADRRHAIPASFELFFRKNPFGGEYTIFGGLEEAARFVRNFRFTEAQIAHLRRLMPHCEAEFFTWLAAVDSRDITLTAMSEGNLVFPRQPLLRVDGPLAVAQMLESTLLCLVNFASLVATNAMRHKRVVGQGRTLLEFGLRRAQGPDGAVTASRYSYLGGSDGTSNVLASTLFDIPLRGTHAHSFVMSYSDASANPGAQGRKGLAQLDLEVSTWRARLGLTSGNPGELRAFTAFARSNPSNFLALIDTYDTLSSGLPNFLCVAAGLRALGYQARGVRLDSGDLAYLSREVRACFTRVGRDLADPDYFAQLQIVASNDLNEVTVDSLNRQGHAIDVFAIGTDLVTCQSQPALGGVYKLVEIDKHPVLKVSQERAKVSIPGRKNVYRLFGVKGQALVDVMQLADTLKSARPQAGVPFTCFHPFDKEKRVRVTACTVENLQRVIWQDGQAQGLPNLHGARAFCQSQIDTIREDHLRLLNPTPYKVAVDERLHDLTSALWMEQSGGLKELK